MRKFDYSGLMELSLPVRMYTTIAQIHEYKGKQALYEKNYSDILERMVDVAKIQSTKASNAIEGIYTNDTRLQDLMKKKTEPKNRNEEEIAGYRHVLDLIHGNYAYIAFSKPDILTLHNQLYSYVKKRYYDFMPHHIPTDGRAGIKGIARYQKNPQHRKRAGNTVYQNVNKNTDTGYSRLKWRMRQETGLQPFSCLASFALAQNLAG
ncbi:MAG: hypothetical protein ACTTJ7_09240 [Treponema sp.]